MNSAEVAAFTFRVCIKAYCKIAERILYVQKPPSVVVGKISTCSNFINDVAVVKK